MNALEGLDWPRPTRRLELRPATAVDAPEVHAYRSRPEVYRYLGNGPLDEAGTAALMTARAGPSGTPLVRVVARRREDGVLVGDGVLGLRRPGILPGAPGGPGDGLTDGWIGYCVAPEHTGQGLATEIARALLELGFDVLGLRRVTATVFAEHEPSRRVLQRVGMRHEARFVAAVLDREGRWLDDDAYAVLRPEWERRRQPRPAGSGP